MADSNACVYCGKPTGAGQSHCPHCGAPVAAGVRGAALGPVGAKPVAMPPVTLGSAANCRSCGFPVGASDIICTHCGVNLLTGQQVTEVRTLPVAPPRNYSLLWAILGVTGALVAIVLIGALIYQVMRDPVGEAQKLAQEGKAGLAIEQLREHLKTHSSDVRAQLLLGKVLWGDHQYRQASDAFSAVTELDAKNADAPLMAAVALHKAKEEGSVARDQTLLANAAKLAPTDTRASLLEALSHGVSKDYAPQAERLKAAVEAGGSPALRVPWAASEALQGNLEGVGAILNTPEGETEAVSNAVLGLVADLKADTQEAQTRLEAAVQSGADGAVKSRLASIYLEQAEYAKALPLLEQARAAGKDDAVDWMYAACLAGKGSNVDAIREFDALSKRKGVYAAAAALELASLYLGMGDAGKANESLLLATQLGNDTAKLYTLRGRVSMKEGDANAAMDAYAKALEKDPRYPAAHLEMGLQYLAQGVLPEGLQELERFLETGRAAGGGQIVNEIELLVEQLKQTVQSQG